MSITISYDVFDTVVTRAFAHPRDVFVRLGEISGEQQTGLNALSFAAARWEAELATRQVTIHSEVRLDEIYDTLATRLRWDEATRKNVLQTELALEARMFRAVPLMSAELDAARHRSGRILFLSDMYLPSSFLGEWMERHGVMGRSDRIFISGEVRGNKSSGRLFAAVRDTVGARYDQWEHVGDHPLADVEKPRALGIRTVHAPRAHLTPRERALRGTEGEFATPWRSLLAGAARLARLEERPRNERESVLWEVGTTVAGPLFYGFVRWTLQEAKRRGLRRLYFLARDGQIFLRLAREIQRDKGDAIECRYLHVSRLVLTGPFEMESHSSLQNLVAPSGGYHSIRQALANLALGLQTLALPEKFAELDPDANLTSEQRAALANWLLLPAQMVAIKAGVAERCAETRAYLSAEGLCDGVPFGVVDTGWKGTSQKNLERILGTGTTLVPVTGFYLGLLPPWSPAARGEMLGFSNQFGPLPLTRDESHKVLLELMAQGDHGQVARFRDANGTWTPVFRDPGPVNLEEIRSFQNAIMTFAQRMLDADLESPAPTRDLSQIVLANYRNFHDDPSASEARVFGSMPHADQVLEHQHVPLCAAKSFRETLAALLNPQRRPPHWWIEGEAALGHAWLLRSFVSLKSMRWRLARRTE